MCVTCVVVFKPSNYHVRSSANSDTSHEVRGLTELQRYEFWVTASTIVGEGESTRPIVQTPNSRGTRFSPTLFVFPTKLNSM